ncbi:MAG: aminodeoxychorismate synthase component I [Campylobacteraceae bacterium]|nr:aminodeoxychorismate synthase component I [Campylobacteraceae bacterium]
MIKENLKNKLNHYGSLKEPFLFINSYDSSMNDFFLLKDLPQDVNFEMNVKVSSKINKNIQIKKELISFKAYKKKFDTIQEEIKSGNSYLLNLTCKTKINCDLSLVQIYDLAKSKFKIKYKNEFVCFSPERFIEIKKNKISTYPMKGTIDANLPNAKTRILGDLKEMAEHTMVVDLLRNDLSMVSSNVRVNTFRYIDKINAGNKELLQISSKISGNLESSWRNNIGDILDKLLPAGSITGCPKINTVKILKNVEAYERGYYTGICGVFDGENLDTFIMIRFIEKSKEDLFYKSGGGITCDSDVSSEYKELEDKIYIPA